MSRKKQHKVYVYVCVCLRRKTKGLALFIVLRFAYPTSIEVPGLDDCSTTGSVPCLPCDLHRCPYVLSKGPTPHYHSLNSFCSIMSIDGKPFLGAVIVPLAPLSKLCPMHLQARMFHHRSRRAITPLKRTLIPVPQLGTCAAACASANFRLCNGIQAASNPALPPNRRCSSTVCAQAFTVTSVREKQPICHRFTGRATHSHGALQYLVHVSRRSIVQE